MNWNLSLIFPSHAAFEQALTDAIQKIKEWDFVPSGDLAFTKETLKDSLLKQEELSGIFGRLTTYTSFQHDLDNQDESAQARKQQVTNAGVPYRQKTATFTNKLHLTPEETVLQWCNEDAYLATHAFDLKDSYRLKKRVLPADQEQLLSNLSNSFAKSSELYNALTSSDRQHPVITPYGVPVQVTTADYQDILHTNPDANFRKEAYQAYCNSYLGTKFSLASIYSNLHKGRNASAKVRGYASSLESTLDSQAIPMSVYTSLVDTAFKNKPAIEAYHNYRKERLGLKNYHQSDVYFPLESSTLKYTYPQALEIVRQALIPLGEEYMEAFAAVTADGFVDVLPSARKRSGAYSWNVDGVGPFILLNFTGTLNDMFTLAHEIGHSIHSYLSDKHQPKATAGYTIFVAEVASTFAEYMLFDYLLKQPEFASGANRSYILSHLLTNYIATYYRQTYFAAYEKEVMELALKDIPITPSTLEAKLKELHDKLQENGVEWLPEGAALLGMIPHFYNSPFYVYQYATSFASSSELYHRYTTGTGNAKESFLTLLKSGGNDHPVALLQKASIDLTTPALFENVNAVFTDLVQKATERN